MTVTDSFVGGTEAHVQLPRVVVVQSDILGVWRKAWIVGRQVVRTHGQIRQQVPPGCATYSSLEMPVMESTSVSVTPVCPDPTGPVWSPSTRLFLARLCQRPRMNRMVANRTIDGATRMSAFAVRTLMISLFVHDTDLRYAGGIAENDQGDVSQLAGILYLEDSSLGCGKLTHRNTVQAERSERTWAANRLLIGSVRAGPSPLGPACGQIPRIDHDFRRIRENQMSVWHRRENDGTADESPEWGESNGAQRNSEPPTNGLQCNAIQLAAAIGDSVRKNHPEITEEY